MRLGDAAMVATATGRTHATIRSWIHRGKLTRKSRDQRGRNLYDLDEALALANQTVQHSDRSRTTTPRRS